ncbi:DNA-binding response regulator [Uliginosibacterium sp. H3]|uniref:DNA-binding response regulator n=1 Tax=Uliginosibacterium silvisoli TaxID=3114758 RepID=A0ABU6K3K8_9RHOO|nr:DNA-binding response regulator [Uliginosibacterium sp. H3]
MPMHDDYCDVLLVDDSADTIALLTQELSGAGLKVHAVRSGPEALRHLDRHAPGAILLDVQMPGMDGFETCSQIRARFDDMPVVFMTGLGETEHIVRGFEVGGNDYVTKPVAPPEVIARLQAHTRTARLVRATREAVNAADVAMLATDGERLLWSNEAARILLRELSGEAPAGLQLTEGSVLAAPLQEILVLRQNQDECLIPLTGGKLRARRVSEADQAVGIVALSRGDAAPAGNGWNPPQLTAREGEVLLWVSRGKTNRDIADILGMSPRTVNKHLEHIFEKLGVETRTAAAAAARNLQLA